MLLAEIQPGRKAELENALETLAAQTDQSPAFHRLTDSLMVISDSQDHLQWLLGNLGQGVETPFAAAIEEHYERGAGWLFGQDVGPQFLTRPRRQPNPKLEIRNKFKTENPNDQTVASECKGASVVIRYAKESMCRATAMPFVRKRLFVLSVLALSFGFVSDFVFRI